MGYFMLFQSANKGEASSTDFTYKLKFLVVVLVFVQGSLHVESFATNRAESYVMVHAVMLVNVTGPPGALLFDRDQRSH